MGRPIYEVRGRREAGDHPAGRAVVVVGAAPPRAPPESHSRQAGQFYFGDLTQRWVNIQPALTVSRGISRDHLRSTPYRSSRNPMYVAALTIWSGWALFYGSVAVIVGVLVLWAIIALVVIPYEERRLAAAWGEPYLQYKSRVSRWFGRVQG